MTYIEITKAYLAITDKYDGGRNYKWEKAYEDLHKLSAKAHGVRRNTRNRVTFFIANLLVCEIELECQRIHNLYEQDYIKDNGQA